jgi:hypothetical protein
MARDLQSLAIAGTAIAIGSAPSTAQDCQNALDSLITIATDFPKRSSRNFLLLLDEFQRIGELTPRKRIEVCDALHLLFNRHPNNLRLVLAFAGGLPEIVESVLTADLIARINGRMDLAPLSHAEAIDYVANLLSEYGVGDPGDAYEPQALERLVRASSYGGDLSPRKINIVFDLVTNAVLDERARGGSSEEPPVRDTEVRHVMPMVNKALTQQLSAYE